MKQLKVLLSQFWRQLVVLLAVIVVLAILLLAHLGTKPSALSAPEVAARTASSSLRVVWHHPINAPFTILQHFMMHLGPTSVAASRLVAVMYGGLSLVLLFFVLRFWHGNFAAGIGTALAATSAWFLGIARLGTPGVLLLFTVLLLTTGGLWLKHTLHRNILLIIGAAVISLCLYVPGIIWFVLAAVAWQRKTIRHELKHIRTVTKVLAVIIAVALLMPIGLAIFKHPGLARIVAGFPASLPTPLQLLRNLYHIPLTLFVWAPANPVQWLGHLPMLNAFEDAMIVLGLYSFWRGRRLGRSKYLLGTAIVGIILITIGGPVTITILLPVVYTVIAVGVLYLWDSWIEVFPHNPLARGLGMSLIIIAVIFSCNYQLRRYFIAWPNAPTTQKVFIYKPSGFDTITTLRKE